MVVRSLILAGIGQIRIESDALIWQRATGGEARRHIIEHEEEEKPRGLRPLAELPTPLIPAAPSL